MRTNGTGVLLTFALVLGACVTDADTQEPIAPDSEHVDSATQEIRGLYINYTYQLTFAREPTQIEIDYWNGVQDFPVNEVIGYHKQWLMGTGSAQSADRQGVIDRSYLAVFNRLPSSCERAYWNNYMISNPTMYRDLIGYHLKFADTYYPHLASGSFSYRDYGSLSGFYMTTRSKYPGVPAGC